MAFGDKPKYNKRNGGNQAQQQERVPLGGVHQLDPVLEQIIKQYDRISNIPTEGGVVANEMVRFNTPDGAGVTMEACRAFLIFKLGFAVPHDSPNYPAVFKINTMLPKNSYHPVYRSRIFWKHSENYWHIPTFTRYVINTHGHIKNAYNGQDVLPTMWGTYQLVPDRSVMAEKTLNVSLETIKMLAFRPLPSDFVDYGSHKYNYVLGYNKESRSIDWVKRPAIVVKDQSGLTERADNLNDFALKYLKGKQSTGLMFLNEASLYEGGVEVEGLYVTLEDQSQVTGKRENTVVATAMVPQAAPAPAYQPQQSYQPQQAAPAASTPPPIDFDDDIPF